MGATQQADFTATDPWKLLGLDGTESQNEIQVHIRSLLKEHHPDRNQGNEEEATDRFIKIGAAYEVVLANLPPEGASEDAATNRSTATGVGFETFSQGKRPELWEMYIHDAGDEEEDDMQPYYFNVVTEETTWDEPPHDAIIIPVETPEKVLAKRKAKEKREAKKAEEQPMVDALEDRLPKRKASKVKKELEFSTQDPVKTGKVLEWLDKLWPTLKKADESHLAMWINTGVDVLEENWAVLEKLQRQSGWRPSLNHVACVEELHKRPKLLLNSKEAMDWLQDQGVDEIVVDKWYQRSRGAIYPRVEYPWFELLCCNAEELQAAMDYFQTNCLLTAEQSRSLFHKDPWRLLAAATAAGVVSDATATTPFNKKHAPLDLRELNLDEHARVGREEAQLEKARKRGEEDEKHRAMLYSE